MTSKAVFAVTELWNHHNPSPVVWLVELLIVSMLAIVCFLMLRKNLQKELKFMLPQTRWLMQNLHSFKPLKRVEKFSFNGQNHMPPGE